VCLLCRALEKLPFAETAKGRSAEQTFQFLICNKVGKNGKASKSAQIRSSRTVEEERAEL
jgi:hypothetical protein